MESRSLAVELANLPHRCKGHELSSAYRSEVCRMAEEYDPLALVVIGERDLPGLLRASKLGLLSGERNTDGFQHAGVVISSGEFSFMGARRMAPSDIVCLQRLHAAQLHECVDSADARPPLALLQRRPDSPRCASPQIEQTKDDGAPSSKRNFSAMGLVMINPIASSIHRSDNRIKRYRGIFTDTVIYGFCVGMIM